MKPVQQEELLDNIYRVLSHDAPNARVQKLDAGSSNSAEVAKTEPAPSRRLGVLLAEDNRFNQQVIQRLLERRGHAVRTVGDGMAALAALEQDAFDLMLLDLNMPELDGFAVIRKIREREKTTGGHLPVIALTALSSKRDRERCLEAGMDDYLVKPVRAAEFYAMIERVARQSDRSDGPGPMAGSLDASTLLAACGEDAELLAEMVQLFRQEAPALLAQVEAALRAADAEQLGKSAHKLRGLVSTFSATAAQAAAVLEDPHMGLDGEAEKAYQTLSRAVQNLDSRLPAVTIEQLRQQCHAGTSSNE
jgi:CheY-like chemotaxis protein